MTHTSTDKDNPFSLSAATGKHYKGVINYQTAVLGLLALE